MKNHFTFAAKLILLLLLAQVVLQACSSGNSSDRVTHDGKNLQVELGLPAIFAAAAFDDIQAYVTLNSGEPYMLDVDLSTNTLNGQIDNVVPGDYLLTIVYFVMRSGMETPLAKVSQDITVVAGQTTEVIITSIDLDRNIDTDNDGYTNLAEVRAGTDAHNAASRPGNGQAIQHSVADASYGKNTTSSLVMQGRLGEAIVSDLRSTNYSLSSGFDK